MNTKFGHYYWDEDSREGDASPENHRSLLTAVHQNSELLQRLLAQLGFADLSPHEDSPAEESTTAPGTANSDALQVIDENFRLREQIDQLRGQIESLERELEDVRHATCAATSETGPRGTDDHAPSPTQTPSVEPFDGQTLSWEERKQLILAELEDDSFDAESFLASLHQLDLESTDTLHADAGDQSVADHTPDECDEPQNTAAQTIAAQAIAAPTIADVVAYIETLDQERIRLAESVALLEQQVERSQAETEQLKTSIGPSQCDEQLRDLEIQASLERAKLSRKNSELKQENETLKRQLAEHLKHGSPDSGGRRWMTKLGLNGDDS